jgi:hypothetical protein
MYTSQGAIPVEDTWMRPVDTVSLLNIIPISLTNDPFSSFLPKYPKSHPHGGGPVRDCPDRTLSLPPSTSQAPSLEEHTAKGKEERKGGSRENKKIFQDKLTTMSLRKMMGCIIHLLLTTTKIHCDQKCIKNLKYLQ